MVVEFDKYSDSEQAELRTIFRSILDENVQEHWEKYASSNVLRRPPDPRKVRRIHVILTAVLLAHAIAFGALAIAGIGNQVELLITAALNLTAAGWLTFRIRARKCTESHQAMPSAG
jgi:anti-sigma factor RsiW